MFIGVTGDTHNNLKNISKICDLFNQASPLLVIHTGDITLPKSLAAFSTLKMPLIGVFGNNDELEKEGLLIEAKKFNCNFFEEPHRIEIDETKIIILHHPELIDEDMVLDVDFIFHGHTHRYKSEIVKNALIFNPGECAGILEGKNHIGLIDTKKKTSEIISF